MFTGFRLLLILLGLGLQRGVITHDSLHPLVRLQSIQYREKKRMVRGLWIAAGLLMLIFPLAHFMVTLGLFTTFLSFTILDESC